MFRPRIIPVLLLQDGAAVKTTQFTNPRYLGDIVNTARLLSEMKADELIVLDIKATRNKTVISADIVKEISSETSMPLTVGGGINDLHVIEKLISSGAEKVVLGTVAVTNPAFVKEAVMRFGSSTIAVCLDVKNNQLFYQNGTLISAIGLLDKVKETIDLGVGELIIQSIEHDGTRLGYNLKLLKIISETSTIPIVALGGANNLNDIRLTAQNTSCTAFAASSMFVLHKNGVLISYPEKSQIRELLNE